VGAHLEHARRLCFKDPVLVCLSTVELSTHQLTWTLLV